MDKKERIQKRKEITKNISNNNQTMWFWGILSIVFCWTIIAPIIEIIGLLWTHEIKLKNKLKLIELE